MSLFGKGVPPLAESLERLRAALDTRKSGPERDKVMGLLDELAQAAGEGNDDEPEQSTRLE